MACTLRTPLSRAIGLVGRNCLPGKSQIFRLGSLQSNLQLQRLAVNSRKMATAAPSNVIFRQLFDHRTYTYTYLLADKETRDAVLIDPVYELVDRDIRIMGELGVKLRFAVNTHCHADHVTATGELKKRLAECKSGISDDSGAAADWKFKEGDKIEFGGNTLEVRATPGHTDGCVTFVWHEGGMAFTGDALLIRGCGRTDFQQGNSKLLYNSVHNKILSLPDETLLYPAHDYTGQTVSTVAEEKKYNTRLTKKVGEFEEIMENLNLPYPKEIDRALPLNLVCGVFEAE